MVLTASVSDWEARAHERCCVHVCSVSQGTVYNGQNYLRGLQHLRESEAMRLGRAVGPFFWSDADMIRVRLCDDCRARLGL